MGGSGEHDAKGSLSACHGEGTCQPESGTVSVWRGSSKTGNCNEHGSGKTADSDVRALRGVFNIGRSIGIGIYECGSRIWRIYTCSDLQSFWKCGKRISFSTKLCESKTIVCPLDCDWKWSVSCGEKGEPCEDKWSDSGENCGLRSERFAEHGSVYGAGGL